MTVTVHGPAGWLALAGIVALVLTVPLAAWFDGRNTGRHAEWLRNSERTHQWT